MGDKWYIVTKKRAEPHGSALSTHKILNEKHNVP